MVIAGWIGIAVLVAVISFCVLAAVLQYLDNKKTKEHVLNYFIKNKHKSSLYLLHNNIPVIDYNSTKVMPLASTAKLIIVIEYAKQVSQGVLKPDTLINVADIEKFYIPGTDGGAHSNWKYDLKEQLEKSNNQVTLNEIARGMIHYSSNACTEYLFDLLGGDSVNRNLQELSLTQHTQLFPKTSSVLISTYIKEKEKVGIKEAIKRMQEMDQSEYIALAYQLRNQLKSEDDRSAITRLNTKEAFRRDIQQIESNRLPSGTTREYASLMNKINSESYFPPQIQKILNEIIDRKPNEKSEFRKLGFKGGTTAFVVTSAMYGTKKNGDTLALAAFINDAPSGTETQWLKNKFDDFLVSLFKDEDFRNKVIHKLGETSDKA